MVLLEQRAEFRHVVLRNHGADQRLEQLDVVGLVVLHEPEVEEGDLTSTAEEVVAGMRITVERVHPIDAAENESEDRFRGLVAFAL